MSLIRGNIKETCFSIVFACKRSLLLSRSRTKEEGRDTTSEFLHFYVFSSQLGSRADELQNTDKVSSSWTTMFPFHVITNQDFDAPPGSCRIRPSQNESCRVDRIASVRLVRLLQRTEGRHHKQVSYRHHFLFDFKLLMPLLPVATLTRLPGRGFAASPEVASRWTSRKNWKKVRRAGRWLRAN